MEKIEAKKGANNLSQAINDFKDHEGINIDKLLDKGENTMEREITRSLGLWGMIQSKKKGEIPIQLYEGYHEFKSKDRIVFFIWGITHTINLKVFKNCRLESLGMVKGKTVLGGSIQINR